MSNKQPEALRLAEQLHRVSTVCDHHYSLDRAAAVELERLHALNGELVEALRGLLNIRNDSRGVDGYHLNGEIAEWDEFPEVGAAESVLAKAEAQQ